MADKFPLLGIVGHDLKFLEGLSAHFALTNEVIQHYWDGHKKHDIKESEDLLGKADIIFCEWFLGNAVWYSQYKRQGQRLIVRFHLQELETEYPKQAKMDNIDCVVFVSKHTCRDAIDKFGWESLRDRFFVIPNAIDCAYYNRQKTAHSIYNIGIVGIAPKRKRLDLALDVLEACRSRDQRFKLFIKGKSPTEYTWLRNRPAELEYFTEQLDRITSNPVLREGVVFDGWDANMGEWYRKIGFILSVSDFEGTHQSVAEGGASGALPIMRNWEGADEVYRSDWIYADTNAMATKVLEYSRNPRLWAADSAVCVHYMKSSFDVSLVARLYDQVLYGSAGVSNIR